MSRATLAGSGHSEARDRLTVLSRQEESFVAFLEQHGGQSDSLALRAALVTSNPSGTATAVNRKWMAAGDPRRIECAPGSTVDPVTGRLRPAARWRLTVSTPTPAAA